MAAVLAALQGEMQATDLSKPDMAGGAENLSEPEPASMDDKDRARLARARISCPLSACRVLVYG